MSLLDYGDEPISIHALREEGDCPPFSSFLDLLPFLSTPSARRATTQKGVPRARKGISIHALREEGDTATRGRCSAGSDFYPRPPRGGRPMSAS